MIYSFRHWYSKGDELPGLHVCELALSNRSGTGQTSTRNAYEVCYATQLEPTECHDQQLT